MRIPVFRFLRQRAMPLSPPTSWPLCVAGAGIRPLSLPVAGIYVAARLPPCATGSVFEHDTPRIKTAKFTV